VTEDRGDGGLDRRKFLRNVALTGLVSAWSAPVISTVQATPAFGQSLGSPPPAKPPAPPGVSSQSSSTSPSPSSSPSPTVGAEVVHPGSEGPPPEVLGAPPAKPVGGQPFFTG
jgi:hypothetical protein